MAVSREPRQIAVGRNPVEERNSFLKRGRLKEAPRNLSEVVEELHSFFATTLSKF
jgi:hypothetical protein